jgi:hypothetical protein
MSKRPPLGTTGKLALAGVLLLIKSILYKNGRGSNPETIVEKSVDKYSQGMYPETTLSGFVVD